MRNATLKPRLMNIAVLTAALQEGHIPRERFIGDSMNAASEMALWWIGSAQKLGIDIQLSAALHRPDAYLDPSAMLDPVAAHLKARTFRDGTGVDLSEADARALIAACGKTTRIRNLGFFENLLHPDAVIRNQIHQHLLRCLRASQALSSVGCAGVTGFIGGDPGLDLDQNVALFEQYVIPLLIEFKKAGKTFWCEQCPMPGWNVTDRYFNNIGYCAGMWIKFYRICQKHGVEDVFRVTYDESHDILMGNTHAGSFAAMKAAGLGHVISEFHGKPNHRNAAQVALWTIHGKKIDNGARKDGQPSSNPADLGQAWNVLTSHHGMIGFTHHNVLAMMMGQEPDWVSHQFLGRRDLGFNPEETWMVLEHEFGPLRNQNPDQVLGMLAISVLAIRGYDQTAEALFQAARFCEEQGVPLPGYENPIQTFPGLVEAALAIKA